MDGDLLLAILTMAIFIGLLPVNYLFYDRIG